MRKMVKRTVAILLVIVMMVGATPLNGFLGIEIPFIKNFFVLKANAIWSTDYILNGEPEHDMLEIAKAQIDKTRSDLGYNDDWCAYFVCDCAKLAGQEKAIPFFAGVNGLRERVIAAGGKESSGEKGDLIFYYCKSCSRYIHVGIVLDSTYTIEGNYSGKVTKVSGVYSHNGGQHSTRNGIVIKTYVRPAYSRTNTLQVYYNANGGSISSDIYKLSSDLIYNKNDSTKYYQEWVYNNTKENGLINRKSFGIYKTGYSFAGWGTKPSGGTIFDPDDISLKPSDLNPDIKNGSCSVTLYAQWIPNTLKVYFNSNGGSISSDTYKISSSVVCNKSDGSKFIQKWTYNEPKDNGLTNYSTFGLYKTGYTFAGWGTKTNGGIVYGQGDNTLVPTDLNSKIKDGNCSVTLYAQWIPNTLKVYFNSNGGSISSDTYKISSGVVCNKSDGSKFTQNWTYNNKKENGLTNHSTFGLYKSGYTFAGWGTKANGGTVYSQGDNTLVPTTLSSVIKNGDTSLTLYAQWVPNTLKVYYNANGGSITSDTYKLSSNLIYTKSDSAKFYQKWTYNNTKENGLYNPSTFGIYKEGYHFVGWGIKPSDGTVFDQSDATVTPLKLSSDIKDGSQSITLYAQWEPNTATVYYNANGGTTDSEKYEVKSGLVYRKSNSEKYFDTWTYNLPNESGFTNASTLGIYRTGYTFAGWSTKASGGTILNQNDTSVVPTDFTSTINSKNCSVTMYAQWLPNTMTVHYQSAGELFCQTHTITNNGKLVTEYAIERTSATQLKYNNKTYGVTGNKTATLKYGVDSNRISISEAGLALDEHIGCGYVAYRDNDGKWRAFINGTEGWYTSNEISKAILGGTFNGYKIYGQTGSIKITSSGTSIYFYAVWVSNHTHSYTQTDSYKGSCTEKSYSTFTCSCGDSYQLESPATGHLWMTGSYLPTCEESGCSTRTCSKCGEGETEYTEPLGHNYVETVVKEPTCTEEGEIEYKCIRCDNKYSEHISTVSHTYTITVIESTCTTNGYTQKICEQCGELLIGDYIEPKGHKYQLESVTPTCTEVGYTTYICRLCGDYYVDDEVSALGHDIIIDKAVESTCATTGLAEGQHCSRCDEATIEQEEIPALGHDIVVDEAIAATCTQTGLTEGQHCSRCNYATVKQEAVPIIAHNHVVKYDSEKHWKECSCGSKIDEQNHSFVSGNICSCGYMRVINATLSIKNNTGSKTINYGETLKLTAIVTDKPADAKIYWYVDGVKKGEGETFIVSFESGTKTVEVKLVDENGNTLKNASDKEIIDSEEITVKAGFFQKLISFFKNLFGMNRTVVQAFKVIF